MAAIYERGLYQIRHSFLAIVGLCKDGVGLFGRFDFRQEETTFQLPEVVEDIDCVVNSISCRCHCCFNMVRCIKQIRIRKQQTRRHKYISRIPWNARNCPHCFPCPNRRLKESPADILQKLESTLNALVDKESSLPAISMSVFYRDEILWSGHFGSKVYKQPGKKPNDSTVYRIGSVTKIFPVVMMYKFYEKGKISSIDDPISKYAQLSSSSKTPIQTKTSHYGRSLDKCQGYFARRHVCLAETKPLLSNLPY